MLLAAREANEAMPAVVEPEEVQDPAAVEEGEARDVEVAARTAQDGAGQDDVVIPKLDGNLVLLGEQALAIGESEVSLELDSALAHLDATDGRFALLEERNELQLAHVERGRSHVFRYLPSIGDEVGERAGGLLGADDGIEPPLDEGLERAIELRRIVGVPACLSHLSLDLKQFSVKLLVPPVAFDASRHDNTPFQWLAFASTPCANKKLAVFCIFSLV